VGYDLVGLGDVGVSRAVEETGHTFEENALLKARFYAAETGLLTLADDSGLEVEALGGAPGVHTARYGGEGLSDRERYERLLRALEGVPREGRRARFRCVIALAWPDGRAETAEGICEGYIAEAPRGENGFGYDPIFYLPEFGATMAELPAEVKNRISHRARASQGIRRVLERLLASSE
ncbi:MAG: RdgB/HAM1 family non-canonical purine NTP pyrophosphatase, partial [Chloroflexi bacterium]|nr:RdgB/HAM1 family non-canonical purine NTP pyrophosphatase [Chloroflexota bacterium]